MLEHFTEYLVTATLIEYDKGSWVDGVYVYDATPSSSDILISEPQPASDNGVQHLTSGEMRKDWYEVWTSAAINLWEDNADPSQIQWGGNTYEISKKGSWVNYEGFSRLLVKRVQPNE